MDGSVEAFVERVPEEYVVVEPSAVDAEVTVASDATPDAALERARALLAGGADVPAPPEIELLTPFVPRALVDDLQSVVLDQGTPIDLVATGEAAELVEQGPVAAAMPLLAGRDDVSVLRHDGDAPFAVLVRPDAVGFALPDGEGDGPIHEGGIEAVLYGADDALREWARDVLDVFRAEGRDVV